MNALRSLPLPLFLLLVLGVPSSAQKPARGQLDQPVRVPCDLGEVVIDWDFSVGSQGFQGVDCDNGGILSWEWGATALIPGAPAQVWGTVLNGNYPDNAGGGLVSPPFLVTEQCRRLEVLHYFDTEPEYDGANVSVGVWPSSQVITPVGGYTMTQISPNPSWDAFCVDGEPGWTGHDAVWRVDCFDLSEYLGQEIRLEFDFGADGSGNAPGWYLGRIRVGSPPPPPNACCNLATGECWLAQGDQCLAAGGEWHPEWNSCAPNPCPQPIPGAHLRLGDYVNPEPWHDWIDATPGSEIPIEVLPGEIDANIVAVEFFSSVDQGATWQMFGFDDNGFEPRFDTLDPEVHAAGNGWSAVAVLPVSPPCPTMRFKALVFTDAGIRVVTDERDLDPSPPSLGRTNIEDWQVTDRDTMGVDINPNGSDIERIVVFRSRMGDTFIKGIPGISQQAHSDHHCAPTATAQCLKYFEAHGDTLITGGLSDYQLVGALANEMRTTSDDGTYLSDWIGGTTSWIQDHGSGYTVRTIKTFMDDGSLTWQQRNWSLMRNELMRCQDVLLGLFWSAGGGHTMTLDAIVHPPLPNGHIVLGMKDPWTGLTSSGDLDPQSGVVYNISGSGNGGSAYIGATMIVCPAESGIGGGGPGEPIFDGLPAGPPPYIVPVSLPEDGPWFIHLVLVNGAQHSYRTTRIVVRETPEGTPDPALESPLAFDLRPIVPNPVRTGMEVSYSLPKTTHVSLQVFDVSGRAVRILFDGEAAAGLHKIAWDATDGEHRALAPGVYFVRLRTPAGEKSRSVTFMP